MRRPMRRLRAAALMVLALAVGALVQLAPAEPAGATWYVPGMNMTCGYPAPAPNAVQTCSTWVASASIGDYSYKIDATQHYGWWGPNWDPGTWHVIVYLYWRGGFVGQVFNMDIGDWAIPHVDSLVGLYNYSGVWFTSDAAWSGGANTHRTCNYWQAVGNIWTEDTAPYTWDSDGYMWPWANDLAAGKCQHGFGWHHRWYTRSSSWGGSEYYVTTGTYSAHYDLW